MQARNKGKRGIDKDVNKGYNVYTLKQTEHIVNRKQFQEWLDQFPEDTLIEVTVQEAGGSWYTGDSRPVMFDPNNQDHSEFVDFVNNPYVKPDELYYNKSFLTLGGKE